MNVGILYSKSAEVNGTKKNRCVRVKKSLINSKRAEQGNNSLLGSRFVSMGVFGDDFAAVDVREELCYHSRPEKAQIRRAGKDNHLKRTIIPKKSRAKNNPNFGSTPRFGLFWCGDLAGNRTRDCAVRGRRLNRLTTRPFVIAQKLYDYNIQSFSLQPFLRVKKLFFCEKEKICGTN